MLNCLLVGVGGFIGASCRYLVGLIPIGNPSGFPIVTLLINVAGAFLMGIVCAVGEKFGMAEWWTLLMRIGVCGGFSTFSAMAYEACSFLEQERFLICGVYVVLSVVLSIAAIALAKRLI